MKKLFTLFVALVAITFCAKAQVTIILEAHNVWGDGSGYQLLLDADHTAYGTTIPEMGPLTQGGDADASVYAEFEYKVPTAADGSLTTTNIVFDGSETITIPAGTYDFCITNPTPGDVMWIAGGENARQNDYVFQDGKTYHFVIDRLGDGDNAFLYVYNTGENAIYSNPSEIQFNSTLVGGSQTEECSVLFFGDITTGTATTQAPFSISTDGSTFGATANLTSGSTLYVKFSPTAAGNATGTVAFSGTNASGTLNLSGSGVVCNTITNFPFHEDFEPTSATLPCWEMVDADGNGNEGFGELSVMVYDEESNLGVVAYFYDAAAGGNDWLISPEMTLPANMCATFQYMTSGYYPEKFSAYVIPQGSTYANAINVMPTQTVTNSDWGMAIVDLSAYANQTVKVAIKAESAADQYYIIFDEFNVMTNTGINQADNSARIYPNPANNNVNVEASSIINNVEIFNMMGQRVASIDANDVTVNINTANLNSGVYMMKVNTENGVINKKFTVAR